MPFTPEELFWHENHRRHGVWKPEWSYMAVGHERRLVGDHALAGATDMVHAQDPQTLTAGSTTSTVSGLQGALQGLLGALPSPNLAWKWLGRPPTKAQAMLLASSKSSFRDPTAVPGGVSKRHPEPIEWPGFFQPRLVVCGPHHENGGTIDIAAISPRGFGAAVRIGGKKEMRVANPFMLTGISELSPLLSASWGFGEDGDEGLMLMTRTGDLVSCLGPRLAAKGEWPCTPLLGVSRRVPVGTESGHLVAATAAWLSGPYGAGGPPHLHVAFIAESSPDLIAIFVLEGDGEASTWLPLGELPAPRGTDGRPASKPSLTFVDGRDLVVAAEGASTTRRRVLDGVIVGSAPPLAEVTGLAWQSTCGLQGTDNSIAHLSLRLTTSALAWLPEVITEGLVARNVGASSSGGQSLIYN